MRPALIASCSVRPVSVNPSSSPRLMLLVAMPNPVLCRPCPILCRMLLFVADGDVMIMCAVVNEEESRNPALNA